MASLVIGALVAGAEGLEVRNVPLARHQRDRARQLALLDLGFDGLPHAAEAFCAIAAGAGGGSSAR
jgi:hypothetical protein